MKSRMQKICTYGSVRGKQGINYSRYDILIQYKLEREGVSSLVYSTEMIMKNEVIHARISEDIKKECESILSNIGISMSQAIDLYLRQIVLKRGIPFELNEIEKETPTEELAYIINSVDGGEVPKDAKKIIHLYTKGDIDLETAKFAIGRIVARW